MMMKLLGVLTAVFFSTVAAAVVPTPMLPFEPRPPLTFPPYYNELDKARQQAFTGRYRHALFTLIRARDGSVDASIIRAQALTALGQHAKALEALNAAKDDPRAAIVRAKILLVTGAIDDAVALLREQVQQHPESIPAHYELAAALERSGDIDAARDQYRWFVQAPNSYVDRLELETDPVLDSAENLTIVTRAIDRWATLTNAFQQDESLHNKLLNSFVRAYDQLDRQYWPAHVAAAEFWLAHDNSDQAAAELQQANEINPNDPRLNELLGLIALDRFNFDSADAVVSVMRSVDRESVRADLLQARTLLASREPLQAEEPLRRVLEVQPKNVDALGLMAACRALRRRDDQSAELLKQVDALDPDNATAYFEVAEQLGAMRQYPRAIAMYKTAIERAPWWTAPRNGLGLLYTQSGDEDDARAALEAAHNLDPFNLRSTNYLRLLDDLAQFARLETPHFIVMYDEKRDPIIAEPMAEYLERIHAEVCREYQSEPPVKTMIEVFPTHDAFSVRTTGSPWIGTVGASTGRVIALVSPRRGRGTMGTFNWAGVLRHEYTHTVTLSATDNRIPHWMTEGLAVLEEHKPMPWDWIPLLYHAVKDDGLFSMEDLTWGFIRPKKPTDRQLAYAQSYWICKYIQETFGHETILRMLKLYREGKLQEEVFPETTGKSLSQFEQEFAAWTRKQVSTWGYDEASQKKYDQLRDRGENLIKERKYAEAVKVWEEIVALRPVDALPHQRLAGLYLSKEVHSPTQAIEHLKVLHDTEIKDNRFAKRLARVYRDANDLPHAIHYAAEATMIDPYDLDAQTMLLDLYQRGGDAKLIEKQKQLVAALTRWTAENKPGKSQ